MTINYDRVADAIYFRIKDGEVSKTLSVSDYLNVDLNKAGETVGMELLNASSQQGIELEKNIMNGVPIEIVSKTPQLI